MENLPSEQDAFDFAHGFITSRARAPSLELSASVVPKSNIYYFKLKTVCLVDTEQYSQHDQICSIMLNKPRFDGKYDSM